MAWGLFGTNPAPGRRLGRTLSAATSSRFHHRDTEGTEKILERREKIRASHRCARIRTDRYFALISVNRCLSVAAGVFAVSWPSLTSIVETFTRPADLVARASRTRSEFLHFCRGFAPPWSFRDTSLNHFHEWPTSQANGDR